MRQSSLSQHDAQVCYRGLAVRLSGWLAALAAALAIGCEADSPEGLASASKPSSRAKSSSKSNPKAVRLLQQAAAALERQPSLTARLRQTVQLYGHRMAGHGRYLQMQNPKDDGPQTDPLLEEPEDFAADVLSRTELTLQVRERLATWEQLCDGKALWTYSKVPDADGEYCKRLHHVDLAEVAEQAGAPPADRGALAWGMGGLSGMLARLGEAFEFHRVRGEEIRGKPRVPVWVIDGRWKPAKLMAFMPAQAEEIKAGRADLSKLPPRVPEQVSVYLGKKDLFPFRIVYRRRNAETGQLQDAVKIELYEVAYGMPLDPSQFEPKRTKGSVDDTLRFLQSYQRR